MGKIFLDFTVRSPATNKKATIELITAFIVAKMCGLKSNDRFNFTLERNAIAIKTIIDTDQINIRAFRSFLSQKQVSGNLFL